MHASIRFLLRLSIKKPLSRRLLSFLILRTSANALVIGMFLYIALSVIPLMEIEFTYWWRTRLADAAEGERLVADVPEESPAENLSELPIQDLNGVVSDAAPLFQQRQSAGVLLPPLSEEPASREFGIFIEKIGVNAPVVAEVDSSSEQAYREALRFGVAHAKGTSFPGEIGNIYIHGHSTLGFWQLGSYAMVFTLLNKLENGDRITLVYEGERFDYQVDTIETYPGYDITPLARSYDESVLTLQTCDPPGTTLNRLIITARLIGKGSIN